MADWAAKLCIRLTTEGGNSPVRRRCSTRAPSAPSLPSSGTIRAACKLDIATDQTGLGEAIADRQPLQVPDVIKRASNPMRDAALEAGLHAALIVPLLTVESPLGTLVLQRRVTGEFSQAIVTLMQASPISRRSRWRTLGCSTRLLRRAASLRSQASTSHSSSPT